MQLTSVSPGHVMAVIAWEVSCDFCSQQRLTSISVLTQFCRLWYYLTVMSISMSLTKSEVSNVFEAFGKLFQEQGDHQASVCFFVPFKEGQVLLVFSYQKSWPVLSAGCEITFFSLSPLLCAEGFLYEKNILALPGSLAGQSVIETESPLYLTETLTGQKRSFYPTWLCTHILMNETTAFSLLQNVIEKS